MEKFYIYQLIFSAVIVSTVYVSFKGFKKYKSWRKKCKLLDDIEEKYDNKCSARRDLLVTINKHY